jgi:long-chain acyl-CoA synthetase
MEVATAEGARQVSGGPAREIKHPNLPLAFEEQAERIPDDPAVIDPTRDKTLTFSEVRDMAYRVAGGLRSLGIGKGDTVAIMLNNRWEFIPIDLGAAYLGGVPFSIYQTSSPEQIQYVCDDAEATVAIIESAFLDVFNEAKKDLPKLEYVVVIDGEGGTHTLEDLEGLDPDFNAREAAESIEPDDFLTLIYTSGTTGPPKGVQLTQRNLMTLVAGLDDLIEFPDRGSKVISWLPAAHIAERGANYYLPMMKGASATICADPRQIIETLPQVHPTFFFAVPRIWEKLKAGLEAKLAAIPGEDGDKARAGLDAAIKKVRLEQAGQDVPEELETAVAQADEGMFQHLRKALGLDEALSVNVGAAPTPVEVLEFFHAIGIPIGELWGMSETCGAATVNPPGKVKLGTVGPPVAGCDIQLADDGEVMVRGPLVMAGYRNLPEKTAETFDGEWLLTGDIGELDEDGYLKIVDRKKELIINAAGKNMSPANIESKLKAASPLIGQVAAIGDARPFNTALIVLDPDFAPSWAEQQGIDDTSPEALADNDKVREAVQAGVDDANSKMSRVEQIKKFKILPTEWMPGGDELTPTMKLKRRPIADKYAREIEELYSS